MIIEVDEFIKLIEHLKSGDVSFASIVQNELNKVNEEAIEELRDKQQDNTINNLIDQIDSDRFLKDTLQKELKEAKELIDFIRGEFNKREKKYLDENSELRVDNFRLSEKVEKLIQSINKIDLKVSGEEGWLLEGIQEIIKETLDKEVE
jgi:hypothetical protein